MKKAETEQQIHARLRELAKDARRLRQELTQGMRQPISHDDMANERRAAIRRTKPRSKKR